MAHRRCDTPQPASQCGPHNGGRTGRGSPRSLLHSSAQAPPRPGPHRAPLQCACPPRRPLCMPAPAGRAGGADQPADDAERVAAVAALVGAGPLLCLLLCGSDRHGGDWKVRLGRPAAPPARRGARGRPSLAPKAPQFFAKPACHEHVRGSRLVRNQLHAVAAPRPQPTPHRILFPITLPSCFVPPMPCTHAATLFFPIHCASTAGVAQPHAPVRPWPLRSDLLSLKQSSP